MCHESGELLIYHCNRSGAPWDT